MAYTQEQPDTGSAMERVTGTISDGDRVIVRDLSILMLETGPRGGGTGRRGCFDLPRDVMPPRRQRFYRLETSDGRSGQIVFVGPEEIGSHQPTRVRFQTSGPFD
jgi:hypothetical protein